MRTKLATITFWTIMAAVLLLAFDHMMVKDWENHCRRYGDVPECQDGPRRNPFK